MAHAGVNGALLLGCRGGLVQSFALGGVFAVADMAIPMEYGQSGRGDVRRFGPAAQGAPVIALLAGDIQAGRAGNDRAVHEAGGLRGGLHPNHSIFRIVEAHETAQVVVDVLGGILALARADKKNGAGEGDVLHDGSPLG